MGIADPAHIHAQQLQLGAEVGAGEAVFTAEEVVDGHLGHFITRRDEAIHAVVPAGAFADGIDIRVGGLAAIVDHDAAALGNRQSALGGQFIARADPGREDDEIDLQLATVGEVHGFARLGALLNDLFGVFAGVNFHAHAFNFAPQLLAAHLVELLGHQHRREFDNMGFDTEVFQGACGFQAEQAAADHRAAFAATGAGFNGVKIFNGAIDEAILSFRAFNRRDPGV